MLNVLITGANRGIGLALVRRYAEVGHRVFACCRAPGAADALNAFAGDHDGVSVHVLEVSDGNSVAALARELDGAPIDILINNAGMSPPREAQTLDNMDYDAWAEAFAVNSMAPLRMLQALRPNLEASGAAPPKAITISSQLGALSLNMPMGYAYSSSKAAVNKVMRMASAELKDDGIAVGILHPGWVQTDMGGAQAQITVEESAAGIFDVIDHLTLEDTGCFRTWEGSVHEW